VAGRSSATANALAAPVPPDPEALALLWAVAPWREELRQLLELLADRADHRLHPLPWALPVPLRVHGRTCREEGRADVLAAFAAVDDRGSPRSHREGVLWHQPTATDLLFVTLRLPGRRPACRRH